MQTFNVHSLTERAKKPSLKNLSGYKTLSGKVFCLSIDPTKQPSNIYTMKGCPSEACKKMYMRLFYSLHKGIYRQHKIHWKKASMN